MEGLVFQGGTADAATVVHLCFFGHGENVIEAVERIKRNLK